MSYDKSEQKYGGNNTKSGISKDINIKAPSKKRDHNNKVWYKKLEDIINLRHFHKVRTYVKYRENKQLCYWVESQRKCYCRFLQDEHKPLTPEHKSALEKIEFVWMIEKGISGKGPIRKKKIPDDFKNGICNFLLCTIVIEYIPIIMMSWLLDLSGFHFTMERKKGWGVEIFICTW